MGQKFTTVFLRTTEYQKIVRLGYADIRYHAENLFGVRFEAWYIKVEWQYLRNQKANLSPSLFLDSSPPEFESRTTLQDAHPY